MKNLIAILFAALSVAVFSAHAQVTTPGAVEKPTAEAAQPAEPAKTAVKKKVIKKRTKAARRKGAEKEGAAKYK